MKKKGYLYSAQQLEEVDECPYCRSKKREIAHANVGDWSFGIIENLWTYWSCLSCASLYLSPRPKFEYIDKAYIGYFDSNVNPDIIIWSRRLLKYIYNYLSKKLFYLSKLYLLAPLINFSPKYIGEFPISNRIVDYISNSGVKKIKFLDIGCGGGRVLDYATNELRWESLGIDLSPESVTLCRNLGLHAIESNYSYVNDHPLTYDVIHASHILEHLYDPINFLNSISNNLRHGGYFIISMPNSTSYMRYFFAECWRGLEAPRHIAIPSIKYIKKTLLKLGFEVIDFSYKKQQTAMESMRIQRRSSKSTFLDYLKINNIKDLVFSCDEVDIITLLCIKK
ncbi:bifunctional 2-polyprenyl-6-hydroxyphenol methylase/3-demethylubiquinol 3-O-methyltransferase UbiG [Polynucleobacter sp. Nonnen-W13]|uniref:class I SAM-dependent methyltransferase n=1 Tax=Polynucleobacter sp. Nonnen-W13 TaxID=1855625 RepID=UPI001C0E1B38|nr:class I SAM-dependent methyltransferase [Polynucleobacter sp. Nonnen-W13]MBU3558352.1 class I SAM-dependent methyltransferase [Polynucleobacter sp. Nonnen-W13]